MVSKKERDGGEGNASCENGGDNYVKRVTFARFCCDKCRLEFHFKKRTKEGLPVGGFYKSLLRE